MSTSRSPIAALLQHTPAAASAAVSHPTNLVKLGLKGPGLNTWAESNNLDLPGVLHEVRELERGGVIARVDRNEIILESLPDNPLRRQIDQALDASHPNLFRVEQQSATFILHGDHALRILAQTCGLDFDAAEPLRIVYTRVAGVSCGITPQAAQGEQGGRTYRLWVDYSYAPYLWEQLTEIASH